MADDEARLNADGRYVTSGAMVLIPAGCFVMGATTNAGHEAISIALPQHTVTVSAFYILGVANRTEAVALALRAHLLQAE